MIVQCKFEKLSSGEISASLTIVDAEDFPTSCIFGEESDFPSNDQFKFCSSRMNMISYVCPSHDIAVEWAQEETFFLAKHLEEWRSICVPKSYGATI